ncbi:hypothetical protein [Draconibacterium halophilum]|uniref:Uncharacterized protein n=1 Tax=Draconibacterium halophilum TaxID=2706887 RepID=A0A6C0RCJ0_9BACT|nr:hypothetical protein [Draconibacterium halophilum]QIA06841.1 hypothetical protein G0Q07_03425 [Draconibacterium halophilum]
MGQAKRAWEESEANGNIVEFLEEMLRRDEFKGALEGIAKQVVDKGVNSMSPKQSAVVDKFIEAYRERNECDRCTNGNVTSLTDLIFISENGLCPMCDNDREKFMRD